MQGLLFASGEQGLFPEISILWDLLLSETDNHLGFNVGISPPPVKGFR